MNLPDVPIEHIYFFIKAVQVFLGSMKKDSLHGRNALDFKIYPPRKYFFRKSFFVYVRQVFFIGGNIYFTKLFSISNKFEDLLR